MLKSTQVVARICARYVTYYVIEKKAAEKLSTFAQSIILVHKESGKKKSLLLATATVKAKKKRKSDLKEKKLPLGADKLCGWIHPHPIGGRHYFLFLYVFSYYHYVLFHG